MKSVLSAYKYKDRNGKIWKFDMITSAKVEYTGLWRERQRRYPVADTEIEKPSFGSRLRSRKERVYRA